MEIITGWVSILNTEKHWYLSIFTCLVIYPSCNLWVGKTQIMIPFSNGEIKRVVDPVDASFKHQLNNFLGCLFVLFFLFSFSFFLDWVSLYNSPSCPGTSSCSPGWPQTYRDPPIFASWVLGLNVCATTARLPFCSVELRSQQGLNLPDSLAARFLTDL